MQWFRRICIKWIDLDHLKMMSFPYWESFEFNFTIHFVSWTLEDHRLLSPFSARTIFFSWKNIYRFCLNNRSSSLPAFVAKIKCSICSSQCDSWDRRYMRRLLSPWFLELEMQLGACSAHLTGWLAIAVPARSAHSPQGGRNISSPVNILRKLFIPTEFDII